MNEKREIISEEKWNDYPGQLIPEGSGKRAENEMERTRREYEEETEKMRQEAIRLNESGQDIKADLLMEEVKKRKQRIERGNL